jgi:hypothetical protein
MPKPRTPASVMARNTDPSRTVRSTPGGAAPDRLLGVRDAAALLAVKPATRSSPVSPAAPMLGNQRRCLGTRLQEGLACGGRDASTRRWRSGDAGP